MCWFFRRKPKPDPVSTSVYVMRYLHVIANEVNRMSLNLDALSEVVSRLEVAVPAKVAADEAAAQLVIDGLAARLNNLAALVSPPVPTQPDAPTE